MNEDMTKLETELQALIPKGPATDLITRIGSTLAAGRTHVAVSDWIFVGTVLAGVASAVIIAVLFATQGPPQQGNWRSPSPQMPLAQRRWARVDPYLAVVSRHEGAGAAEFSGLIYP